MLLPVSMTPEKKPHHIDLLREDFNRRRNRNPRFSLRAYSRYLGVDPSSMSRILNEKEEISLATCITVLKRLGLDDERKKCFVESVLEDRRAKMLEILQRGVFGDDEQKAS